MTFRELTNVLLYERQNYKTVFDSLYLLHDFYAGITGISAEHTTDNNLFLPSGKAISPGQAANCLLDLQRTTTFLRGIHKAIVQLQKDFPGQPVNILYAGCGPYATLLTPLTTIFGPDEVRFHLMDVHKESLEAVEKLYAHLHAENYIEELICQDATTYRMEKPMQLVICEAMQSALEREPQVAITLNLVPQMQPGSIFIPQEIRVTAQMLDREQEMNGYLADATTPKRILLGEVYSFGQFSSDPPKAHLLDIPTGFDTYNEVHILTELTVFEDEKLAVNNCGITLPRKLADVVAGNGRVLKVEYEMGEKPGFKGSWSFDSAQG